VFVGQQVPSSFVPIQPCAKQLTCPPKFIRLWLLDAHVPKAIITYEPPKGTTTNELPKGTFANETPKKHVIIMSFLFLIWLRWKMYKK
jgi:hypothetical protein